MQISQIRLDGGTQSRAEINTYTVADYAEKIKQGQELPPVVVFHDGSDYWLADGFHRYFAVEQAGLSEIPVEVRPGTKRDAILFSVGSNSEHGLPRTNADKHHAVNLLLEDEEWGGWSDSEIARRCKVTHPLVGKIRKSILVTVTSIKTNRTFTHPKTGGKSTMNIVNIGQKKPALVRVQEITALALEGNSSSQIGKLIGVNRQYVRDLAHKHNIDIPGDITTRNTKIVRPTKVIDETIILLDGLSMGVNIIQDHLQKITPEQAQLWIEDFSVALKPINALRRKLRGIANEQQKRITQ